MNMYVNELYTHPFWTACFVIFLWRIIISFRNLDSGREMVILITVFFFLMAATPVFIGIPFTEVKDKTIYGIMNLFVFPAVSIWAACFMRQVFKKVSAPVFVGIVWCMMISVFGGLIFMEGFQKLFP